MKDHEGDSDSNKIKSSSKMFFWGSPDLSLGIEKLFDALKLWDNSKSFIISDKLLTSRT
jgi:hypothetical protein